MRHLWRVAIGAAILVALSGVAIAPGHGRAAAPSGLWSGTARYTRTVTGSVDVHITTDWAITDGNAVGTTTWTDVQTESTSGQGTTGTLDCVGTKTEVNTGTASGALAILFTGLTAGTYPYEGSALGASVSHTDTTWTNTYLPSPDGFGSCGPFSSSHDSSAATFSTIPIMGVAPFDFTALNGTHAEGTANDLQTITWALTSPDTDHDVLVDAREVSIHHTDPANPDTDGDGLTDGSEVFGDNQCHFTSDPLLVDTDGDGYSDAVEVLACSDPGNAGSVPIVTSQPSVLAWGDNGQGQLGNGTTAGSGTSHSPSVFPAPIAASGPWASISAGYDYGLAVGRDGTAWAWGVNGSGQLGIGGTTATRQRRPRSRASRW